ncbi:hypothetical protein Tco_1220253 [Tanacetum coccineum]
MLHYWTTYSFPSSHLTFTALDSILSSLFRPFLYLEVVSIFLLFLVFGGISSEVVVGRSCLPSEADSDVV